MSLPGWLNMRSLTGAFLLINCSLASAAIQLQQTRLVYPAGEPSIALAIKNSDSTQAVAINSWVESDRRDISILPARVIIEPMGEEKITISIPDDGKDRHRERLYWLNVKAAPVVKSAAPLAMTVINRIKLFYRPKKLFSGADNAYRKLTIGGCSKQLMIKNPTPYYISFYSLKIDKQEITDVRMIAPYESVVVSQVDGTRHTRVHWQAILDTGFHSPILAKKKSADC